MLIVVSGLPGTGKSAVAAELAARLDGVHLSIDPIEEALLGAGLPRSWETGVGAYEAARAMAELNLDLDRTVVVDAVNDSEPARNTWRVAAERAGVRLGFVLLTLADETEHRRRLEGRVRDLVHVREPSWADVRARRESFEPWTEDACLRLDAERAVAELVPDILAWLAGR
ncbi:AAA family ATPase [Plantactinospora siamensis]|uniref:AAA family ATPase n=1 Tax=Plantactinospora siamensis TaxID=555372 RepID=A0ABV6NVN8_9ACTN